MENAVDALKMAGAVMLFIIALSTSMVAFTQVRETSDIIINYADRETEYINGDFYYEATGLERKVGLETVIPAIYRVYSENYKIVFKGLDDDNLFTYRDTNGNLIKRNILNSAANTIYEPINVADRRQNSKVFLNAIIYGDRSNGQFDTWYGNSIILPNRSLYDQIKNKTITEKLGVYYTNDSEDVPDADKEEKRVIIYEIE